MSACDAAAQLIENRTLDELSEGDSAEMVRVPGKSDIELFAVMSGDVNPAHLDAAYADTTPFHHVIAHGMWGGALISAVLGTRLPGPGTIYTDQSLHFRQSVAIGDTITTRVTVARIDRDSGRVTLDCLCRNQHGKPVIEGHAEVLAPRHKVRRAVTVLPMLRRHTPDARSATSSAGPGACPPCPPRWSTPAMPAPCRARATPRSRV
ncbi:MAG: MaoC/PaaZ C-terminal domain-containing protein [Alkalilacustris sp.]